MKRSLSVPVVIVAAFVIVATAVGVWAFSQLDARGRSVFYGDVATLSYQAIVIVLLGALIKKVVEDARDHRMAQEQAALNERQIADMRVQRRSSFISQMVHASHVVDVARTQIWANRSVKAWTEQMNEMIAAYVSLRDLRHEAKTSEQAGDPIFRDWEVIRSPFARMEKYLSDLINEYAAHKKALAETQIHAEASRELQPDVWEKLKSLERLGDFINGGKQYVMYRDSYVTALAAMRTQLPEAAVAQK